MLPGSPDHFGIPVGMFRSQQGSQKKTVQPLSHWHFLLVENNRGAYHQTWVLGVATLSVLAEFFALVGIDLVLQVACDHRYVLQSCGHRSLSLLQTGEHHSNAE